MKCSCAYFDGDEGERPEFYSEVKRKARKAHKCYECRRVITTGELYHISTGKWDAKIQRNKVCADCRSIQDSMFCDGYYFGSLLDDLEQHVEYCDGQIAPEVLLALTPAARDRVFKLIELQWADADCTCRHCSTYATCLYAFEAVNMKGYCKWEEVNGPQE